MTPTKFFTRLSILMIVCWAVFGYAQVIKNLGEPEADSWLAATSITTCGFIFLLITVLNQIDERDEADELRRARQRFLRQALSEQQLPSGEGERTTGDGSELRGPFRADRATRLEGDQWGCRNADDTVDGGSGS